MKHTQDWWDEFWLGMAEYMSKPSKDPSTQVGAVLIDEHNGVVSTGYNGFPRRCDDREEYYLNREKKYLRVLHAEENALFFANRQAHTAYITHHPCSLCTARLIQHGIQRIVFRDRPMRPEWEKSFEESRQLCWEAMVEIVSR